MSSRQSHRKSSRRGSCRMPCTLKGHKIPSNFVGYCVACRSKRKVKSTNAFTSKNPRNKVTFVWACGKCPKCKTKVCRVLGGAK